MSSWWKKDQNSVKCTGTHFLCGHHDGHPTEKKKKKNKWKKCFCVRTDIAVPLRPENVNQSVFWGFCHDRRVGGQIGGVHVSKCTWSRQWPLSCSQQAWQCPPPTQPNPSVPTPQPHYECEGVSDSVNEGLMSHQVFTWFDRRAALLQEKTTSSCDFSSASFPRVLPHVLLRPPLPHSLHRLFMSVSLSPSKENTPSVQQQIREGTQGQRRLVELFKALCVGDIMRPSPRGVPNVSGCRELKEPAHTPPAEIYAFCGKKEPGDGCLLLSEGPAARLNWSLQPSPGSAASAEIISQS